MADAVMIESSSSGSSLSSMSGSSGQPTTTSSASAHGLGAASVNSATSTLLASASPSSANSSLATPAASALQLNPVIPMLSVELQPFHTLDATGASGATSALAPSAGNSLSSGPVPPLPPPPIPSQQQTSSPSSNTNSDSGEPEPKRKRLDAAQPTVARSEKLESRLGGILCCAVCLDLPKGAMYQCQMGHLMCAACFTHLLADGRLRDQTATCPNCRVEISKSTASRNLAVEKAVSELPSECQYCGNDYASKSLERHEQNECDERPTSCRFQRIGCQWKGPLHEALEHQAQCLHPKKSGAEVMLALEAKDASLSEEKRLFGTLIDLLSYEKIIFNDLQLKPYRTDEYVHKLFYETSRFSAFNHQWVVKARINNSQRDPHTVNDRQITYQLILKTKTSTPLSIHFFGLKGPFSDTKINTQIYKQDFTDQENESEYYWMPLPDSSECNRLLAAKAINFRLIMFLLSK